MVSAALSVNTTYFAALSTQPHSDTGELDEVYGDGYVRDDCCRDGYVRRLL